jgi:hypothetical protein
MTFDFLYDANSEPKSLPNPSAGAGVGAGVTGAGGAGGAGVTGAGATGAGATFVVAVTVVTVATGAIGAGAVTGAVTGAGVLWNSPTIYVHSFLKMLRLISLNFPMMFSQCVRCTAAHCGVGSLCSLSANLC